MRFPVGFLLFGCASLSSCERVKPKLSASVANSTVKSAKADVAADLDALDAAVSVVDKHLVKADAQKKESKQNKVVAKKVAKKTRKFHWVAPAKPSEMPDAVAQKSPMFQKEKNLVVSKEAESVLNKGDAKAHEKEEEEHQKAVEKLAPANVVHVAAAQVHSDVVADAKDLKSDLQDLKQRIVADSKHQEEVEKEQAEEIAEKKAQEGKEAQAKPASPEKKADLNKLMKLSDEMKDDANPAPKPKTSAAFLQQQPNDGIREKSGIDSAAADLEETARELESHPHQQKKKPKVPSNPHEQQYGALSHLADSIAKAKKVQEAKVKEEAAEKEKRRRAQHEAQEDADALSGTVPAFDDPRLKEVKVTHVQHLSPSKLKSLKAAVGKMQDSVYVEPVPVKNAITDLKVGQESVVGESTVHMHARDGFGERPAPMPKLPPAPKALPPLPMAPPGPPKPHLVPPHSPHPESPLAPTVVSTVHANSLSSPPAPQPVPKRLSPVEENAKHFEKVMHQNVVNMHAALRETVKETQEQIASKLAAKKRAEEAKLAREMQTAEEKRKQEEQKEKAKALRKEEEQKAADERNFAHQQMLDYRAAQKKARELKEQQMMKKKKDEERLGREKKAREEAHSERVAQRAITSRDLAEPRTDAEITEQMPANIRPTQFVADPTETVPKPIKESKGSALTQTIGLSTALAMVCLW